MTYLECPDDFLKVATRREPAIFMGGGISNCPDWQLEIRRLLADTKIILVNPRRANFPMGDPTQTEIQIKWEHRHLNVVDARMFWFCKETLCPITLFELGKWCIREAPLFVGCDPEYARIQDLKVQLRLERPGCLITHSLEEMANKIKSWVKGFGG